LIVSIRHFYPSLRILVCDDSRKPLFANDKEPIPGVKWLTLPFEAGHTLGAGRNYLIAKTETKYAFLCDDDHEFTAGTRLHAMWSFLEKSAYDIVGGAQGPDDYGAAIFERKGDQIMQHFYAHRGEVAKGVVACDRVSNTFLARTDALRRVKWLEAVYAHEHADFFLRATAAGLKIAQMGGTWVGHDRRCEGRRGLLSQLFGAWMAHPDEQYRQLRMGGHIGQSHRAAKREAAVLYKTHVLDHHRVLRIVDNYSTTRRRALEMLIGKPTIPLVFDAEGH